VRQTERWVAHRLAARCRAAGSRCTARVACLRGFRPAGRRAASQAKPSQAQPQCSEQVTRLRRVVALHLVHHLLEQPADLVARRHQRVLRALRPRHRAAHQPLPQPLLLRRRLHLGQQLPVVPAGAAAAGHA
jgi:hypothetical protein